MTLPQVFGQVTHTRFVAISVTDGLVRALRIAGEFPRPLGPITCHIVRQLLPVARTFDPPLLLQTFRNASGFLATDGSYRADAAGPRTWPLGAGTYRVEVRSPIYQAQGFDLLWPPAGGQRRVPLDAFNQPATVELRPGPAYPLPDVTAGRFQLGPTIIRGTLVTAGGDPVRDVPVEVINLPLVAPPPELPPLGAWPFLSATSGPTGDFALVLPGRRYIDNAAEVLPVASPPNPPLTRAITVRIHLPNVPALDLVEQVAYGSDHAIRNTALRGQVVSGGGRPVEGAQVTTSLDAVVTRTRADGVWFRYFRLDQADVAPVTVTATTPAGAVLNNPGALVRHGATIVVPTFHFA
jgi:hypothetical protein